MVFTRSDSFIYLEYTGESCEASLKEARSKGTIVEPAPSVAVREYEQEVRPGVGDECARKHEIQQLPSHPDPFKTIKSP